MGNGLNGIALAHHAFTDFDVPPELEEGLQRHRQHLARFVVTLRSAGMDDAQIEASVAAIVTSYQEELIRAMKRMVR